MNKHNATVNKWMEIMQPNERKRTRKGYESVILTVTGKNRGQTTAWYALFEHLRDNKTKENKFVVICFTGLDNDQ